VHAVAERRAHFARDLCRIVAFDVQERSRRGVERPRDAQQRKEDGADAPHDPPGELAMSDVT
jgi:hypothetical protein